MFEDVSEMRRRQSVISQQQDDEAMTESWLEIRPVGRTPRPRFPVPDERTPGEGAAHYSLDASAVRVIEGYRLGYFPFPPRIFARMPWWNPDPRGVLSPQDFHLTRSFRRFLRHCRWTITFDRAFRAVILHCARPRQRDSVAWLTGELVKVYLELAHQGRAHSVEVWEEDTLVGGLFGVSVGAVFSGDSMFSRRSNASKVALLALCRIFAERGGMLVDCQIPSAHLLSLGAKTIPRAEFLAMLAEAEKQPDPLAKLRSLVIPASSLLASDHV